MGTGFTISLQGFDAIDAMVDRIPERFKDAQNKFGLNVEREAKQLVPVDEGRLKNAISYKVDGANFEIIAATNYAAYIEFGTRGYAAKYVASLPADWQTFAKQFQGRTGGGIEQMILAIVDWVHRKGSVGRYSVKTKRRLGNKTNQVVEDYEAAYRIARAILIKGIKPQPYMYPAINNNIDKYKEDLTKLLAK